MLNEERVKVMVRLATYESGEGRDKMKIGNQRKKDFISLHMLVTWLLVTLAYFTGIGLFVYVNGEELMNSLYNLNWIVMGVLLFTGYMGIIVLYLMIAHRVYTQKYKAARRSMKPYYLNLKRLNRLYKEELQKTSQSNSLGGEL